MARAIFLDSLQESVLAKLADIGARGMWDRLSQACGPTPSLSLFQVRDRLATMAHQDMPPCFRKECEDVSTSSFSGEAFPTWRIQPANVFFTASATFFREKGLGRKVNCSSPPRCRANASSAYPDMKIIFRSGR